MLYTLEHYSVGFYWTKNMYNVYLDFTVDGEFIRYYCNICRDDTEITRDMLIW